MWGASDHVGGTENCAWASDHLKTARESRAEAQHHDLPKGSEGTISPCCTPPSSCLPTPLHSAGGQVSQGSSLSINTSPNISIKTEPISPPRDRVTPSGFQPQPQPRQEMGRSPVDSLSSSSSSYDGSDREEPRADFHSPLVLGRPPDAEDRDSPSGKRMRMDAWVT